MFVSETLKLKKCKITSPELYCDLSNISIEIGLGRERKTVVNLFYQEWTSGVTGDSSTAATEDRLKRQINYWKNLHNNYKDIVLMGDQNLCALTWNDDNFSPQLKPLANLVNEFIIEENHSQIVKTYTRSESYNGTISRSCVDHVMTDAPNKCTEPLVINGGDSDHLAVIFTKYSKNLLLYPLLRSAHIKTSRKKSFLMI